MIRSTEGKLFISPIVYRYNGGMTVAENTNKRNGVTANLTDAELAELDAVRGAMSRSAFVRECVIAQVKRMKNGN